MGGGPLTTLSGHRLSRSQRPQTDTERSRINNREFPAGRWTTASSQYAPRCWCKGPQSMSSARCTRGCRAEIRCSRWGRNRSPCRDGSGTRGLSRNPQGLKVDKV